MAKFLLIHGSWHGGWCWERLLPILRTRGHEAWAPTLIGLAERAGEATAETGLQAHVDQIAQWIQDGDRRDLIVVGHSYAGLVMMGAAELVPDRIQHLVFLDALVPDHDRSAFDLMPGVEQGFVHAMQSTGSDFLVPPMSPEDMGITDPADIEWAGGLMTPMPILTHREKVNVPQRKARTIPSTYIYCLQFGLGEEFAENARADGWQVHEMDAGHDVMVTEPQALADLLEQVPMAGA